MELDWGDGKYETTASQLEKAAVRAVEVLEVRAGDEVLDLGCGTGNAALVASRCGGAVTAIDPASRLLDTARGRAEQEQLEISFKQGEAAHIPADDASYDGVVAVFSIIFAPDAAAAAREIARVVRPGGRVVVTSWVPKGAIHESVAVLRDAEGYVSPWSDEAGLRQLFRVPDLRVRIIDERLPFEAESPEAWFEDLEVNHPAWRAARTARATEWDSIRTRCIDILTRANEVPGAFRVTSEYKIACIDL